MTPTQVKDFKQTAKQRYEEREREKDKQRHEKEAMMKAAALTDLPSLTNTISDGLSSLSAQQQQQNNSQKREESEVEFLEKILTTHQLDGWL